MGKQRALQLDQEERVYLERVVHAPEGAARTKRRAHILLWSDRSRGQAHTDQAVAAAVGCSVGTVRAVRRRYLEEGLAAALNDKPRPGAERKITAEIAAQLVVLAQSAPPNEQPRWTLRQLAERLIELGLVEYVSHVTVRKILQRSRVNLDAQDPTQSTL